MSAALLLVTRRSYLPPYWPALCSVDGVMGQSYGPSLRGRQDSKLFGTVLPIIPWSLVSDVSYAMDCAAKMLDTDTRSWRLCPTKQHQHRHSVSMRLARARGCGHTNIVTRGQLQGSMEPDKRT